MLQQPYILACDLVLTEVIHIARALMINRPFNDNCIKDL